MHFYQILNNDGFFETDDNYRVSRDGVDVGGGFDTLQEAFERVNDEAEEGDFISMSVKVE